MLQCFQLTYKLQTKTTHSMKTHQEHIRQPSSLNNHQEAFFPHQHRNRWWTLGTEYIQNWNHNHTRNSMQALKVNWPIDLFNSNLDLLLVLKQKIHVFAPPLQLSSVRRTSASRLAKKQETMVSKLITSKLHMAVLKNQSQQHIWKRNKIMHHHIKPCTEWTP